MVAAWKAGSETEENWERVRARAMVTTEPGERTAELRQQIGQLMATLTQTDGAAVPPVHQVVLGNMAMNVGAVGGAPSHPNSHSSRAGPQPTHRVWGRGHGELGQ